MTEANRDGHAVDDYRPWTAETIQREGSQETYRPTEKPFTEERLTFLRDGTPIPQHEHSKGVSTYQSVAPEDRAVPNNPQPRSSFEGIVRRLGALALTVLIVCPLFIVAGMAFLAFLWFSDRQNMTWRFIVANDHLITVVAGISKIIEAALQFSIGTACAMLAALLLEGYHLVLHDAAEISVARLSIVGAPLFAMLWKQMQNKGPPGTRSWALLILSIITTLMLIFSQTITVILNADISLSPLQGFQAPQKVSYGFHIEPTDSGIVNDLIQYHGTVWSRKPMNFPAFAEFSSPPVIQDGVSDTGKSLRAFLPYASQLDRQNLQSYTGYATVVDTRVTCQVPELHNVTIGLTDRDALTLFVAGGLSSTQHTPRLMNDTLSFAGPADHMELSGEPMPINCTVPVGNTTSQTQTNAGPNGWRTSLCQLSNNGGAPVSMFTGGLFSEFQPLVQTPGDQNSSDWGVTYVFLNVTQGNEYDWRGALGESNFTNGLSPEAYQNRDEWRDYVFSDGELIVSTTVCYASFMTADLPVVIESPANRTEPVASFNFPDKTYVFPEVRAQLGQASDGKVGTMSLSDRGVLALQPQRSSWLANSTSELPVYEPYIRAFANMAGPESLDGNTGNYSAILWDTIDATSSQGAELVSNVETDNGGQQLSHTFIPDPFFSYFFQDIVANGGSVAFALQSMYTVMAGMAYFDQMPQFDATNDATRTDFVTINIPARATGFIVVAAFVLVHLTVLALITLQFAIRCRHSYLGDPWAMIAQTFSPATANVIDNIGHDPNARGDGTSGRDWMVNSRAGLGMPTGASRAGITLVSAGDQHLSRRSFRTTRSP